ncbi:MAG: phosphotransferase [Candidatus Beckwithbacteria bacterium]|nr:phosphotransferase [Patescibacteria group bacterium]
MSDIYYPVAHRLQEEIDSFKTRYDNFDTSLIPKIFIESLKLTVIDFKPSKSWGSSHLIYFVTVKEKREPLVLRANLGFNRNPETVMVIEKLITEKVTKLGVPTNTVIYADVSRKKFPFDFQIQEVLQGKDPEIYFKGSKADYNKISFDLGIKIAKLTKLKFKKFGRFNEKSAINGKLIGTKNSFFDYITVCLDDDIRYLVKAKVINNNKSKIIRQLFDQHKAIINLDQGSLIHHDLADHNITFQGTKVTGIFDWETAVIGDPVLDLASCPTWRTFYPREEKLIKGYQTITDLPDNFKEKMNIYRLRTMLWKIVYAIRMDILNEQRKETFYNALKSFNL